MGGGARAFPDAEVGHLDVRSSLLSEQENKDANITVTAIRMKRDFKIPTDFRRFMNSSSVTAWAFRSL
jgi:hypothetical protein